MAVSWISPWSGEELCADRLMREVALDALSQLYIAEVIGIPGTQLAINNDSITVTTPTIDYSYDIPFPSALSGPMQDRFSECLACLKNEYRCFETGAPGGPSGETLGDTLRYFKTFDRLIRIVSAERCWPDRRVLVMHGLPPDVTPTELRTILDDARLHYLLIYPDAAPAASGYFKAVGVERAVSLVHELWGGKPGVAERFFGLERAYGRHRWLADDNAWTIEE